MTTIGAMATCTIYGYKFGQPTKLMAPIDGDKNICGITPGYEEYPDLFIGDINTVEKDMEDLFEYGVCVKSCPETKEASKNLQCKPTAKLKSCVISDTNSYASFSVMRYCVPDYDTLDSSIQS